MKGEGNGVSETHDRESQQDLFLPANTGPQGLDQKVERAARSAAAANDEDRGGGGAGESGQPPGPFSDEPRREAQRQSQAVKRKWAARLEAGGPLLERSPTMVRIPPNNQLLFTPRLTALISAVTGFLGAILQYFLGS